MRKHINGSKIAIVWTILRVWLGFQWIEQGYYKISSGFEVSGFLQGAIANASGENPTVQAWYANFLEGFALPNSALFNILVPWGELLVGLGLILGLATIPALIAGAFMNLNFMLAGIGFANPDLKLFTLAIILFVIGKGRSYYGLDRIVIPSIKKLISNKKKYVVNS